MAGMSTQNPNQNPNEPTDRPSWGSSWDAVGRPDQPGPGQSPQGTPAQPGAARPEPEQAAPTGAAPESEATIPGFQPSGPASASTASRPGTGEWQDPGWTDPPPNQWQTGWHTSAQYPGPAGHPQQQPGQAWQQPTAGHDAPGGEWVPAPGPRPRRDSVARSFLGALFDLDFRRYVTPQIVRILYILSIAAVALYWIGSVVMLFAMARSTSLLTGQTSTNGGIAFVAVLDLLFGWIFALAVVALIRMQYEYMIAIIRTSEYARDITAHLGAGDAGGSTPGEGGRS